MIPIQRFQRKQAVLVVGDGPEDEPREFVILKIEGDRMMLRSKESMDAARDQHKRDTAERQEREQGAIARSSIGKPNRVGPDPNAPQPTAEQVAELLGVSPEEAAAVPGVSKPQKKAAKKKAAKK